MACAIRLLPVPRRPRNSASSRRAMNASGGQFEDQAAVDLRVESEVGVVECRVGIADVGLLGPARFPAVPLSLGLLQTCEMQFLQGRPLIVADSAFDLTLAIRLAHAAGRRDDAVMREHVPLERVQRGCADVGSEHAFVQVAKHKDAGNPAQPTDSPLVQFDPDAGTGVENGRRMDLGLQSSLSTNNWVRR